MNVASEATNKALVLVALDTLFNQRDYCTAEQYWSPSLILHSAHIAPGRDGLFEFVRAVPATLRYEPGAIAANEDYVIVHGRISGNGRSRNWIMATHSANRGRVCCRAMGGGSRRSIASRNQEWISAVWR